LECPHKYVLREYLRWVVVVEVQIEFEFLYHVPKKILAKI
jgi:hypothetical protein